MNLHDISRGATIEHLTSFQGQNALAVASIPEAMRQVRELFREYADSLGFTLEFQDFDRELANLPGCYAPPGGALFLAHQNGAAVGCVGVRRLESDICEMKRLYVRPNGRGLGLGRRLALAAMNQGRAMGYTRMRLDTLASMVSANALYDALGFHEIPAYCHNPLPGVRYLECRLGILT